MFNHEIKRAISNADTPIPLGVTLFAYVTISIVLVLYTLLGASPLNNFMETKVLIKDVILSSNSFFSIKPKSSAAIVAANAEPVSHIVVEA